MRAIFLGLALLMLFGCTLDAQPYVAYDDPHHPLALTAVLSVAELQGSLGVVEITRVDGRETACEESGCPVWVRVLPGQHAFNVRITARGAYIVASEYRVEVAHMEAGHVYVLDTLTGAATELAVRDLGRHPAYSVNLGPDGTQKRYPVKFQ